MPHLRIILALLCIGLSAIATPIQAQGTANLVGRLQTLTPTVQMRRIKTTAWLPIRRESLFGVGDSARVNRGGSAQLSLLDGLLITTLTDGSQVSLTAFNGDIAKFTAEVKVETGLVTALTRRVLGDGAAFRLNLPAFSVALLEGQASIRVEANGRSAVLMGPRGRAEVTGPNGAKATLSAGEGLRAEVGGALSEVVPAVSFPTLDIALDGCPSQITLNGDIRQNVRLGATTDFEIVGGLANQTALQVMGITGSGGWYRIRFAGGLAWIQVSRLPLPANCIGLRLFPDGFGPEDRTQYTTTEGK